MRTATTIAQSVVRIAGLLQLGLGIIIWTGTDAVIPVHVAVGTVLIVSLWVLAYIAGQNGVDRRLVGLAAVWGLITPIYGLFHELILPGGAHVVIQVLHLLVGFVAIGLSETLAARIKGALAPSLQQPAP
jgi:hypothetical protein